MRRLIVENGVPWRDGARRCGRDGRYIVACPACEGSGRVVRPGSQVPVGCRLCWERGRVSRIVAERFTREASDGEGACRRRGRKNGGDLPEVSRYAAIVCG